MSELHEIPTVLMDGDEIVEVCFTTWEQQGEDYQIRPSGNIPMPGGNAKIDHVVFELPNGCYEIPLRGAGQFVEFHPGSGYRLQQCRRSRQAAAETRESVLSG